MDDAGDVNDLDHAAALDEGRAAHLLGPLSYAAAAGTLAAVVLGFVSLDADDGGARARVALGLAAVAIVAGGARLLIGRGPGRGIDGDLAIGSLLLAGVVAVALAVGPVTPAPRTGPGTQPAPDPLVGPADPTSVEGRPLRGRRRSRRRGPQLLRPAVVVGPVQWSTAPEPGLSPSEQAALAGLWLEAARYEHASIAAFARLGRDLRAVGAPACLVDGARRAALDEVDHAQRCFAIASRLAHRDLRAGTLRGARAGARRAPRGRRRKLELERVAVESLLDGCLNEAYAAAIAAGQAAVCTDARIAADLASMAREEAGHAALAWDTLEWCLATGGEEVRVAVLDALRTAAAPRMTAGESVAADALARYGRARTAAIDEALRDVHRQVWVRLDEIVDAGAERGNLASDIEILSRPA